MLSPKMWLRALRVIPRLSKKEWNSLDIISRWLVATRAAVFIMTAIAAAVGGLMAWYDGHFRLDVFLLCFFGLVFAHGTNNLVNDLTDHKKGIDKDNYYRSLYGPQPLEHGLMTMRQMLTWIIVTGMIALSCGLAVVYLQGIEVLYLIAAGAFFVLFYTWPLKYIGLGEPSVVLVWGPLMVGGTYYAVSGGEINTRIIILSLIYAQGPTTVLFGKHTDKLKEDIKKKVHTLPVIIGEKAARISVISMWVIQYISTAVLIYRQPSFWPMAIVLLALPKFISCAQTFSRPRPLKEPKDLPKGVWPLYLSATAFVYNRSFGSFFLLGLIILALIKAFS